jgi:hypothetical protein
MSLVDGQPAILQLNHFRELEMDVNERLACEIANQCGIPYYVPEDVVVGNLKKDFSDLNSGGNLDVLPGGSFFTGVGKRHGRFHAPIGSTESVRKTKQQEVIEAQLSKQDKKVLELDVSFLSVGHVDEIVNVVKTNGDKPCDYALMIASPSKAIEILENESKNANSDTEKSSFNWHHIFNFNALAGSTPFGTRTGFKCTPKRVIAKNFGGKILSQEDIDKIYQENCIGQLPLNEFMESSQFQIIKNEYYHNNQNKTAIKTILEENRQILVDELVRTTGCQEPKVIEIPVLFRSGKSVTPDLVNGFIDTPDASSPSNALLPRSYFKPFDDYVQSELSKHGVNVNFVHDMEYHINGGEVHCGTNEMRICK